MKTLATITALVLAACAALHADLASSIYYINFGTGPTNADGDARYVAFQKLQSNSVMLATAVDALAATNFPVVPSNTWSLFSVTNGLRSGDAKIANSNGVPVVVTLAGGIVGVFNLTNYSTHTSTSTITAYDFTNQVLASRQVITYQTNYAYWDRVAGGSNYLGRFNGIVDWSASGGDDGGNPPGSINVTVYGSLTGTNGWFALTNGYYTTNMISIAVKTNGLSNLGHGIANPGSAVIWTMDHWELYHRTNYFDYQKIRINTPPTDNADLVNKFYVDNLFANAFDNNWSTYTTNTTTHFVYSYQNRVVFDITSSTTWIPLKGSSLDGPMTHILVDVYQTNLTAGYDFQSSTNLALKAGFTTFTNYTLSTNTGVVTFTVPIVTTEPQRFFRIISSIASGAAFNVPLTLNSGTIYPSNTWSLATVSNAVPNFGFWQGSSNGQSLVTLWKSNTVGYYVTWSNGVAVKTPAW